MTVGIGGWGSRRKPMALVRALAGSDVRDLTVVSYGGPDVGVLCAAGKVRRLVFGFVSLDSIPLEPWFRHARQTGALTDVWEIDEGMLWWGLYAAACGLPFLPIRAGMDTDVVTSNPWLKTVKSPYDDGAELLAMPALKLDLALCHAQVADAGGNCLIEGPDPYFDDLFLRAATRGVVSCERQVDPLPDRPGMTIPRLWVDAVVEVSEGAWFTECPGAYERDEQAQRDYAATAGDVDALAAFWAQR
jgi:glutaconate CoA-transferase subunit A